MPKLMILGSGVVGHATGAGLRHLGHDVTFVDVDEDRLASLRDRGLEALHADEMTLDQIEAVFVSVPTPSSDDGIDLSHLDQACKSLGANLQSVGHAPLIVFRSTVPPGTTRDRLIPNLEEASDRKVGQGFNACFNPEYLRQRNADADFVSSRFVTVGTHQPGDAAARQMRSIFASSGPAVTELTFEEAEFQKYVHNLFNALKISYFNEMRQVAGVLGLERVDEVFTLTSETAEGMWNRAYGTRDLGPYGGACLPKDTMAWLAYCREYDLPDELVRAASSVNVSIGGRW